MSFKKYSLRIPNHLKIAFLSWISRGFFLVTSLYNIKLTTGIIKVTEFAIYAILANVVSWLLLADIGIGYSIQNFISELRIKKKDYDIYIISGLSLTYVIALLIGIIIVLCNDYFANILFKNFYSDNIRDNLLINSIFFYSCIGGLLTGVGTVSHKILYAKQLGYWPNILSSISSLTTLGILLVLKKNSVHDFNLVLIALFLPNIIVSFLPSCFFFAEAIFSNLKNIKLVQYSIITYRIINRGWKFFVFSITAALVIQIDYVVMSQTLSPDQISEYNIVFKIYNAYFLVYTTLLLSLWPSISEWYVLKQYSKILFYCRVYIFAGVIFIIISSIFLKMNSSWILPLISDIKFELSNITVLLFCSYFSIRVWCDTYAIILQSTNRISSLWIFTPLQALISLVFQIILSKLMGINGILLALLLSFLLTVFWGLPYQVKKILN